MIVQFMNPSWYKLYFTRICLPQLVDAAVKAYHEDPSPEEEEEEEKESVDDDEEDEMEKDKNDDNDEVKPKDVGHNIYILAHQLSQHNKGWSGHVRLKEVVNCALTCLFR